MYVCLYACMHACMHACMYVCMYVFSLYIMIKNCKGANYNGCDVKTLTNLFLECLCSLLVVKEFTSECHLTLIMTDVPKSPLFTVR